MQQFADSAWKADGAARRGFEQLMTAPEQMSEALLMLGIRKVVVRRPAIVNHDAGVIEAKNALGRFAGTRRIDDIGSGVFANQSVQPGILAADMPARFVEDGPRRCLDGVANILVDRLAAFGGTQDDMGAAAARQADAEQRLKNAADLAVRHAGLLVEFDDGGLSIGAKLCCCRAERVGSLQGMPALHAPSALLATADVNVELPVNRSTRDLDLILLIDVRLFDVTTAVGTFVGQRRVMDLIDPLGWLAMGLGAVLVAGFATRLLRLGPGWPLGERRSLSFASATLFFEQAREAFDLKLTLRVAGAELGDFSF